jgi:hypothetical protein
VEKTDSMTIQDGFTKVRVVHLTNLLECSDGESAFDDEDGVVNIRR